MSWFPPRAECGRNRVRHCGSDRSGGHASHSRDRGAGADRLGAGGRVARAAGRRPHHRLRSAHRPAAGARRPGSLRARRLHPALSDPGGGAPPRHRHDLSSRRVAVGGGGRTAAGRLERQYGRRLQRARGRPPIRLPGLLPELDRSVRPVDAARPHAASHDPAAHHDVWGDQSCGRAAVRLLRRAVRRRHARPAPAGADFPCGAAGRRHHRLCGRDLPPGGALRALHLLSRPDRPGST